VTQSSYAAGSDLLAKLARLPVPAKQVERITKRIGLERSGERDEAVAAYLALPLVQRKAAPAGVTPPAVAVVGTDGGRLQILDDEALAARGGAIQAGLARRAAARAAAGPAPAEAAPVPAGGPAPPAATAPARTDAAASPAVPDAAGPPAGTDDTTATPAPDEPDSRFWREAKTGLLMAMTSPLAAADPCPDIPETFVDPRRMGQLVRELGKQVPLAEDPGRRAPDPAAAAAGPPPAPVWKPPEVQEKRLVATRRSWDAFGPMLAAAAWAMGLFAAPRRAFLGDGAETNWTVWRCFFSSFEPVLDFIHALSYVYAAAHAGRSKTEGWKC
jgi:hypothetical protein